MTNHGKQFHLLRRVEQELCLTGAYKFKIQNSKFKINKGHGLWGMGASFTCFLLLSLPTLFSPST
jgi:hypothetical protein